MICQDCGIEAPTKYVAFYQNIGVLVMRFTKTVEGNLCKSCIHKNFWSMTLITLCIGWLGMISLVLAPFFVLNNLFRYLGCLSLEAVPPDAATPRLTEEAADRIGPYTQEIVDRLNDDEEFEDVAEDIADKARVSPGQVMLYVRALVAAHRDDDDE
ncbi:MAG: hypothetical protein KDA69_05825 [Planctomycetaceae bacterium]|nr:hypothetical protein [Planctomycetaceae bacterium]